MLPQPPTGGGAHREYNSIHQFTARCTNSLFDSRHSKAFTITAAGTGLTYQWRLNGVNLVDGANVAGSTTATLSLSISCQCQYGYRHIRL